MNTSERIDVIFERLTACYGRPECALHFSSVFELLIAVMLSAQCTDARVNIVTSQLFKVANTPEKMLALGYDRLSQMIFSVGFYRNKARNVLLCCADLIERFGGGVPSTREELVTLAGVGDKTASVVFAVGFGGQAIPVDTHVGRLARRLGLSEQTNPTKVMRELESAVAYDRRTDFHHLLITHGRQVCSSQRPKCDQCAVRDVCVYVQGKQGD